MTAENKDGVAPLEGGTLEAILGNIPGGVALFSEKDGVLRLDGSGQWVGSRLRFNGEARAAPGHEAQLANLLNLLGRRQGDRAILSQG